MVTKSINRRAVSVAVSFAAVSGLILGAVQPSYALQLSPSEGYAVAAEAGSTEEIRSELEKYNVPQNQADRLIEKLGNGEMWDSLAESSQPVSVEEFDDGNEWGTIERYEDGSIAISSIKNAPATGGTGIQPFAISNCKVVNPPVSVPGADYQAGTNCMANRNWILINQSFMFDYLVFNGSGSILNHYGAVASGAGEISGSTLEKIGPGTVRMNTQITVGVAPFAFSQTLWIQVDVDGNGPRMSNN